MLCITLFYFTLTLQIMLINGIYLDMSVGNIPITQGMDYSVYACSPLEPVLLYNAGSDWLVHTQNKPCKAPKCILV